MKVKAAYLTIEGCLTRDVASVDGIGCCALPASTIICYGRDFCLKRSAILDARKAASLREALKGKPDNKTWSSVY